MKWKDLSLKERKQIYDSVRVNNPDATYFDIKEQFDSIPAYEGGKAGYTPEERAWVARRTVELGMEGKPAPQDSLYTIVDRAKVPAYEDGIMLTNTDKGYVDWKSKLAPNLKNETYGYDLYGAYKSGAQQQLEDDGYYHLPTRDPKTNKILKYPSHKTFWLGITEDIKQGYYPQVKDGRTYTVPVYEDGGKKIMPPKELGLTPGTPEYYKRQQQISGRVELVQPEAYVTPAGYIKDAITTAEELEKGNYGNAAISTLMNFIPWGVGKGLKKIKSRVSNTLNTPIDIYSSMVDEYPSILAEKVRSKGVKNIKKLKEESDYDSEFSEVIRRDRNIKKYEFVDRMNNLTPMEFISPLLLPVSGYQLNKHKDK